MAHYVKIGTEWKDVTNILNFQPQDIGINQYVEGTRTSDTCCFAKTKGACELRFSNLLNLKHRIVISNSKDEVHTAFPVSNGSIYWHGDK